MSPHTVWTKPENPYNDLYMESRDSGDTVLKSLYEHVHTGMWLYYSWVLLIQYAIFYARYRYADDIFLFKVVLSLFLTASVS